MKATTKRKTNESRVCSHFAKAAGVEPVAYWGEQSALADKSQDLPDMPWFFNELRLMPLECDVMSLIMHDKLAKMDQDLLFELIADPGTVMLVQDSKTVGAGSLWFVCVERAHVADKTASYAASWPVRMLTNAFAHDGKWWYVMAVQMVTLFRNLTQS